MTDRLHVDPALLDAIAERLVSSGARLDASAGFAPASPDAGHATPLVADLLQALLGASATLVGGLHEVGACVSEARLTYTREDLSAGQSINGTI